MGKPNTASETRGAIEVFRVLSLDGGGAKGFYTLGALLEIEALAGASLCERFDLIYGTSTGAIIAALLGLGKSVEEIKALYETHVVTVMARWLPRRKTAALEELASKVFGGAKFDAFKTCIGIVGTRWTEERPIIFKNDLGQAFFGKSTFDPGFGCTIGDAVIGSCSAYPFFRKKIITTSRGERIDVRDGGFVANNPTLYALADAIEALGLPRNRVRIVSIGVGEYQRRSGCEARPNMLEYSIPRRVFSALSRSCRNCLHGSGLDTSAPPLCAASGYGFTGQYGSRDDACNPRGLCSPAARRRVGQDEGRRPCGGALPARRLFCRSFTFARALG
jgi:hypothetical protein